MRRCSHGLVFTFSPTKFATVDLSARSSLVLLDKNLIDDEDVKGEEGILSVRFCERGVRVCAHVRARGVYVCVCLCGVCVCECGVCARICA